MTTMRKRLIAVVMKENYWTADIGEAKASYIIDAILTEMEKPDIAMRSHGAVVRAGVEIKTPERMAAITILFGDEAEFIFTAMIRAIREGR